MQCFYRVIFIICILNSSECSLFKGIYFDSAMNGDVLLGLNASTTSLTILFNLGEVVGEKEADHVVIREGQVHTVYSEGTHLYVSRWRDECIVVNYSSNKQTKLMASVNITGAYMYGGAEDDQAKWPLGSSYHYDEEFVSQFRFDKAVLEPYWLLSNGYYIYVDNRVPLFLNTIDDNIFQLIAQKGYPYVKHQNHALNFTVCKLSDALHAQKHAIQHFLGKPSTLPDERLVTHPVWSTEGKFLNATDPNKILLFAQDIAKHGLTGQLRIDRIWEDCTGSFKPRQDPFSFENLIKELKKLNFTVALAIDAYVGYKCNDTYDDGIKNNYFVKNNYDDTSVNGQPDGDRLIDLTNPDARNWYLKRLQHLRTTYGIDSFKLDNVSSKSPPQPPIYHTMAEDYPETIVKESAKVLASLGSSVQTTVARNTQKYGFYVRMVSRVSSRNWGLKSIIPTLLQFNILGYSFVVPDKIGGGEAYDYMIKSRELYIRWIQLNVFMPTMEFGIPPWQFDDEVLNITKKFVNLHARYSSDIIELMKENVKTGVPVNRPLWWIAPNDTMALKCSDEFLLGDRILVAPVIEEGKRTRNVYLPAGVWKDGNSEKTYNGPTLVEDYPAELNILPYFLRD